MSRKDPRSCLLVPVSRSHLRLLRDLARGRSLADQIRKLVEAVDLGEVPDRGPIDTCRHLPVQVPRHTRADLERRARRSGVSAVEVVTWVLEASVSSGRDIAVRAEERREDLGATAGHA